MPMIVGMLVDQLGFTASEAGYIASAEMSGIFVASIITSAIVNKVNRRWIMVTGLVFCIVGNIGSYAIQDFVPMLVTTDDMLIFRGRRHLIAIGEDRNRGRP